MTQDVEIPEKKEASNQASVKNKEQTIVSHRLSPGDAIVPEGKGPRHLVTSTPEFIESLFADGNECITAPGSIFPVKEETRLLLALFSNGRFLVAEPYKHDGRVLSFQVLAKKRNLQVGDLECVSMAVISDIYEYATQHPAAAEVVEEQDQIRMQRDFVTIITHAAKMKVSDIHIIVADHTTVMFRVNGMLQAEMEYNNEWGEAFVRAAFASADISDSNYAQNEYQAAQKLGKTPLRGSKGRLMLPPEVLAIRLQFNPIAFGSRYVVMRLLYDNPSEGIKTEQEFGEYEQKLLMRLRSFPTGLVIVAGPTSSGKSTTLVRNMSLMLKEHHYEINMITVEDPVEQKIFGAHQMPVVNTMNEEQREEKYTAVTLRR